MKVRYHPRAREEVLEAARYYNKETGTEIARAFYLSFLEARLLAENNPEGWCMREHATRRVNLKRFPYYIAYLIEDDCVWVVAVAHASKRPFYWKDRLPDQ